MGWEKRWWGWGDDDAEPVLGPAAETILAGIVDPQRNWRRPEGFADIQLPAAVELPPALSGLDGLEVSTGAEARVRHAVGKGYTDLARLRLGRLETAPDAVIEPASAAALAPLLEACAQHSVAVVPFGGGTSVVGGVEALRGALDAVISLDLRRLGGVQIDPLSRTARLGAGLRAPVAEAELNQAGYTLGHFPQSFEQATIGGFAATRSAGQASTGYGRFDALVTAVNLITPVGTLGTIETPHSAAGPALRELVIGSEGCLGVIPDVTVRIKPLPGERRYETWFCEDFEAGAAIIRELAQAGRAPDVIRLSDSSETALSLAASGPNGASARWLRRYLRLRGVADGCLIVAGWEGQAEDVRRRRALSVSVIRKGGGVYLGRGGGRSWLRGRFNGPYLRDVLLDRGLMVETLETAHSWAGLDGLYRTVGKAIEASMAEQGHAGLVMCHLSHAYPDGASLYFTFFCAAELERPLEQWQAVKRAASQAIVAAGGTITHHHAVGRDHLPWMLDEVGELGLASLAALKQRLDPVGIMNPGKLIPA